MMHRYDVRSACGQRVRMRDFSEVVHLCPARTFVGDPPNVLNLRTCLARRRLNRGKPARYLFQPSRSGLALVALDIPHRASVQKRCSLAKNRPFLALCQSAR